MDGGAYCTLTPVVLSRGVLHAGGPYRCPNVRLRGRATRTNTAPNGAFRGFGAPQTEFAAEMQMNRARRARSGISPAEIRRRNVYRLSDTTPTGQVLRESVAGEEVLEQARRARATSSASASGPRARPPSGAAPARSRRARSASGDRRTAQRHRPRARRGTAPGFTGSGEVYLASVASVELTADGAHPGPDREHRDGPGHQDRLPADGRRRARRAGRLGRVRAPGHRRGARLRARPSRAGPSWSSAAS